MSRNRVIIGLVLLLFLVMGLRFRHSILFPFLSNAQTETPTGPSNIGPHAAFFDSGNNIKIANMTKSKTPANIPITVMVDINASAGEIASIVNSANGLRMMIRIVGVDVNTTVAQARNVADALNGAGVPAGTLVVFGNELNNLDKEWKSCPNFLESCPNISTALTEAGTQYRDRYLTFREVASAWTAVPAPPDMYNGNYSWREFVQAAGVYNGQLVANSYAAPVPDRPENLNPATGGLYSSLELYKALGNVVAFTEYGTDPNNSLQEHIDFLINTPLPSGIQMATTLIPDKCNPAYTQGADMWLYFIQGRIFDADGNEITNIENCSREAGEDIPSDYRRFVYPFYSEDKQEMLTELAQDYDVSCVPKSVYQAGVSGDVSKLIDFGGCNDGLSADGNACYFEPSGATTLSTLGNRLFGVLRDEGNAKARFDADSTDSGLRTFTNRFESVEQWFGANNPKDQTYSGAVPGDISELHQGPIYKLADTQMQCQAAGEVLRASQKLCEQWEAKKPPEETDPCPLSVYPVRGIGDTGLDTLSELANAIPGSGEDKFTDFCNSYYDKDVQARTSQENRLRKALSYVDLFMETAYRPAFLVAVTEVDPPIFGTSENQRIISTRNDGVQLNPSTKQIVDYLVYHVPATLTDDMELEPQIGQGYSDVIAKTAQIITPQQTIDDFNNTLSEYRDQVNEAIADVGTQGIPPIQCNEPECLNEPLRNALITYLNAVVGGSLNFKYQDIRFDMSCEHPDETDDDTLRESGDQIGSNLQQQDSFSDIVDSKQGSGIGSNSIDEVENEFDLQQYFARGGGAPVNPRTIPPQTKLYNISPHRANAEFVASRLDALFSEAQQSDQFTQDKGYYDKFEALLTSSFASEDHVRTYTEIIIPPDGGTPSAVQQDVRGVIANDTEGPQTLRFEWLAKIFNRSTRAVSQLIFGEGTSMLDCARANNDPAHNTEEFLRNCQNKGAGVPEGESPIAQCTIDGGFGIESTLIKNTLAEASQEYRVPVQVLMATLFIENCRSSTPYNGVAADICEKSDAFLSQLNGVYPHTAGCPGMTRTAGSGIFQFDLRFWDDFAEPGMMNACGIRDPFFAAARLLSANFNGPGRVSDIGKAPPANTWSIADMKRAVTRWAANVDTCDGHPFAQEYCRVIDALMGQGGYEGLTGVTTTCNGVSLPSN